ncbi:hypothetical protein [Myxococcus sp. CA039A]|uniref:hypothetical protein n=1 Tax=Myxococcus sp. CA039A TaxID=2741737 RepID=UPI00157A4649|nr:hypothetical protein [Myxococcus sp. CA039A]NTX49726.1 hypothetical protein [Myxococcus sp. CA039A]
MAKAAHPRKDAGARRVSSVGGLLAEAERQELLRALRALPQGAGPAALRGLATLLEAAVEVEAEVDPRIADELIRVLGPVMGEDTPVTVAEAAAVATGSDAKVLVAMLPGLRGALSELRALKVGLTGECVGALSRAELLLQQTPATATRLALESAMAGARTKLASELSRLHAPVPITSAEVLPIARWVLGDGPPPAGAAVLELARRLDDFCHRAPLTPLDLEELRVLARKADAERESPGWPWVLERLRTVRPRLMPRRVLPPLYRSLAGAQVEVTQGALSLEDLLR